MPGRKKTPAEAGASKSTLKPSRPSIVSAWPDLEPPATAWEWVRFVFDQRYSDARRKLVHAALARHADEGGRSWPGVTLLAAECGCSKGTVRLALRELKRDGYLRVDYRPGSTSVYVLLCPPGSVGVPTLDGGGADAGRRGVNPGRGGVSPVVAEDTEKAQGKTHRRAAPARTREAARSSTTVEGSRSNVTPQAPPRKHKTGGANVGRTSTGDTPSLIGVPHDELHEHADIPALLALGFEWGQDGTLREWPDWYSPNGSSDRASAFMEAWWANA